MQNQQLVDYIKQQMQGGVALDAVKKALLDAGWPAADVEDSIKAAAPAATAASAASAAVPLTVKKIDPVEAMGGSSARVATAAGTGAMAGVAAMSPKTTFFTDSPAAAQPKHSWGNVAIGVMAVLIVLLLGALGYVYYTLNGKVAAATGQNASGTSQAQSVQDQLTKLAEDKNNLNTQVGALTADNQALMSEVGFFVPSTSASVSSTVKGTVGGTTGAYTITTPHGIVIAVKNSKDAKVDASLKPLVGQTAELSGTHRPGVAELTVTAVNGIAPGAAANPIVPAVATTTSPAAVNVTPTPPAAGFPPATTTAK